MIYVLVVEADNDVEITEPEVSLESQLSIYHQLQTQLFRSVLDDATQSRDEADVRDLVGRFRTLQDRQMKIITAIQASRYTAEQVEYPHCHGRLRPTQPSILPG